VNGFLLKVDSNYVRRMKNHILEFFGENENDNTKVGCIVGNNGYIWIYAPDK
jgi:exosome complex RNA-binding protein Rrp4